MYSGGGEQKKTEKIIYPLLCAGSNILLIELLKMVMDCSQQIWPYFISTVYQYKWNNQYEKGLAKVPTSLRKNVKLLPRFDSLMYSANSENNTNTV